MPHLKEQWVQEGDTLIGCSLFCWSHCSPTLTDRQRGFTIWGHNQSLGTTAASGGRVRQCGLCTYQQQSFRSPLPTMSATVSNVGHGNAPTLPYLYLYVKIHVKADKRPTGVLLWLRPGVEAVQPWLPGLLGVTDRTGLQACGTQQRTDRFKLLNVKSLMLGSRVEQKRHEHTTLQPIITLIWQC